jgi:tetratricopeptide (TPR) repeat protein
MRNPVSIRSISPFLKYRTLLFACLLAAAPQLYGQKSNARTFYQLGVNAFSIQNYYDAAEHFKSALETNPNYSDALLGLAKAYFYLGEYQEALNQLNLYDRITRSVEAQTLKGRSYAALGQKNEAQTIFEAVLRAEPNNLDAQFGMAEVNMLSGRTDIAIRDISRLLRLVPDNRRALLSLSVLYDNQMKFAEAEPYITQALFYYPQDSLVLYMAGLHYQQAQNWEKALQYYDAVLTVNPNYTNIAERRAEVLTELGRYQEAAETLQLLIRGRGRSNADVWSTLAQVFVEQGDYKRAFQCYDEALRLAPNNELTRFAVEQLVQRMPADAQERLTYAQARLQRGNRLQNNFNYRRALREYRWALLLAPEDAAIRFAYARQLDLLGIYFSAIDQLKLLKNENKATQYMLDVLESKESEDRPGVAQSWGFSNGPKSEGINLYLTSVGRQTRMEHQGDEALMNEIFIRYMERFTRFNLTLGAPAGDFTEAWRQARAAESNFFAVLRFAETDRSLYSEYKLYLTSTGSYIGSYSLNRSSADKIDESFDLLSSRLDAAIPIRAKILRRDNSRALIDLGKLNGININDEFIVVRSGAGRFISNAPYFEYMAQDELGRIKITRLDEYVGEGEITSRTRNDLIAQEDTLYLIKEGGNEPQGAELVEGIPPGFLLIH